MLAEYLRKILVEQDDILDTILTYKDDQGEEKPVTARSVQKAGEEHPAWPQLQRLLGTGKPTGAEEPMSSGDKETAKADKPQQPKSGEPKQPTTPTPSLGVYGQDPSKINATKVENEIKYGYRKKRPLGNDFSRYQEAMSVVAARWIIDNPDATDQEIMEYMTSVDCKGSLLAGRVSATLPKEYETEFNDLKNSGAFSNQCSKGYSATKNKARFMTMLMAKRKADRMKTAMVNNNMGYAQFDSFSGSSDSISRLKKLITGLPEGVTIKTETGTELSKEQVLELVSNFGVADAPADTTMIAQSPLGDIVFISFSDKKELNAIINNSTVTRMVQEKKDRLKDLVERGLISEEDAARASKEVDNSLERYKRAEEDLRTVTKNPARELLDTIENNPTETKELIKRIKKLSSGKNKAKYWNERIRKVFRSAADNKYHRSKVKYLEMAGWSEGDRLTDEIMLKAFAFMSIDLIDSEEGLNIEDQRILGGVAGDQRKQQLVEQVGVIRDKALSILSQTRETLNALQITTTNGTQIGAGTYLDAIDAWRSLHLDMKKYGGAMTMAVGDQIIDYEDIEHCLGGISDDQTFAEALSIETRRTLDREYGEYTTGQNVEVFSVSPEGRKIRVGLREIRSKSGLFGKLETTFKYHTDFQKCLKSRREDA